MPTKIVPVERLDPEVVNKCVSHCHFLAGRYSDLGEASGVTEDERAVYMAKRLSAKRCAELLTATAAPQAEQPKIDPAAEALIPCPFCGEPPHVVENDSYEGCHVGCNCEHEPSILRKVGELNEAKAAWNRRALAAPELGETKVVPAAVCDEVESALSFAVMELTRFGMHASADVIMHAVDSLRASAAPQSATQPGDWPEDAGHENGQYQCRCLDCGRMFIGHKRRITCKVCALQTGAAEETGSTLTIKPQADRIEALEAALGELVQQHDKRIELQRVFPIARDERWIREYHAALKACDVTLESVRSLLGSET